jgi:hypothetical protein
MALCQGRRLLQRSWNRQLLSEFIPAFRYEEMHTRSIFKLSERIQESMEGQYGTLLTRLVGCDPQTRWFRSSQLLMDNINVEIQSMGESISEGTIAEVLKSEGDSVGEDETIAQIETDKVTIDVKAPSAGTLTELRVRICLQKCITPMEDRVMYISSWREEQIRCEYYLGSLKSVFRSAPRMYFQSTRRWGSNGILAAGLPRGRGTHIL